MAGLWIKVDTGFYREAQLVLAGPMAKYLHVVALCFCRENMTDGILLREQLPCLAFDVPDVMSVVAKLEAPGRDGKPPMWEPVDGGWRINSYLDMNQSAEAIRDGIEQRRSAGRSSAYKRRHVNDPLNDPLNENVPCRSNDTTLLCSTTVCSSSTATAGTPVPENADWEPDDPAYRLDPAYDGKADVAWWQQHIGKIQRGQVPYALNALQRLHVYFKRSPREIRAMMEYIESDPKAKGYWGSGHDSPASWITVKGQGKVGWQAIAKSMGVAKMISATPKQGEDIRPTPKPLPKD